ncbi:MAG: oligosaccharide flippase family protein [candidate division Zixibacteria bacterium]|nr:oligosaccharide flippase family protein [candidate division Zixibacteria bacterium]
MPSLLRQFGKNIVTSWAGLVVRMLVVFLVNPIVIHSLGNHLYGVWVLIFSIVNYMTILDLGLQQALIRYISKFLGNGDYGKINSVLNTAFVVYSAAGIAVIIISAILSFFALNWFNIPAEYIAQGRAVLMIIGLNVAINFIMLPWGGSLGAFHRFDIANGIAIAEDILRTLVIIFLLKSGYGIVPLALTFLIFTLLRVITATVFLKRLHAPLRFNPRLADRSTFRMLIGYGVISFLISIAWMLIVNSSNVLIGYFIDTSAVTIYAIAVTLLVAVRNLISAVAMPLRPLVSHYETKNEKEIISLIYMKGTRYLYFLTFLAAGGIIVFADHFIALWMGPGYEASAGILRILVVPLAVYLPHAVGTAILYGIEKHTRILYVILAEGILNLGGSILLIQHYGLPGVAFGTAIAQIIIYLFVMPRVIRPILNINLGAFYSSIAKAAFLGFAISFGLSYLAKIAVTPENWGYFFGEILIVAFIGLLCGYFVVDRKDLEFLKAKLWNGLSS